MTPDEALAIADQVDVTAMQVLAAEVRRLREIVDHQQRDLDEARKLFPADGIWCVKDGRDSCTKVAELYDLSIAEIVGNLGRYVDAAARGITMLEQETKAKTMRHTELGDEWVRPSNFDLALAALREVAVAAKENRP